MARHLRLRQWEKAGEKVGKSRNQSGVASSASQVIDVQKKIRG